MDRLGSAAAQEGDGSVARSAGIRLQAWMRKHPLLSFFVMAYAFAWIIEVPYSFRFGACWPATGRGHSC